MDQVGQGWGVFAVLFVTVALFGVFFVFFLLMRKIMLWYWKIDEGNFAFEKS